MFRNDWKRLPERMIIGHCIIRNKRITVDGKDVFASEENNLDTFLLRGYENLAIAYPKFYKMDALSKLGFLATEVLLKEHPLERPEQTAIVLSNSNSSLDTDVKYAESAKSIASPALFVYTLANIVAGEICIRHKMKGENAFFITREFDPVLMESYVASVMEANPESACIAGWVDVLGEHHDVFLYLLDHSTAGLPHSAQNLRKLYTGLWNN